MKKKTTIALIAHDMKKHDIVKWALDNKELLDGITADAISQWSSTDASTISGYSIVVLTEEEYNALGTVDDNTIYIVKGLE